MNRRNILKGVGIGLGTFAVTGSAISYYSIFKIQKYRPLAIGGSTTVKYYIEKIANAYAEKKENIHLLVDGGRSYAGLVALEQGGIDIAMMSRDIMASEERIYVHNYLIGIEAIALVVNDKCPISNISLNDAHKVLNRQIINWKSLGGPDAPIKLFSREDGSTTKESIKRLLLKGGAINEWAKELRSSNEMAKEISLDPLSFGYIKNYNLDSGIKALRIDEVELSDKAIYVKMYPLIRELYLVIRDDSSLVAKDFLDYVLSNNGQEMLANIGLVRVR